jgi:tetratricopeptide (TPR) repeat protein
MRNLYWFVGFFILGLSILLVYGNCTSSQAKENLYKNISNEKAKYVGIEKCASCHADIYKTYMETGMGKSWDLATKTKSAGNFDPSKAHVFDAKNNLHYRAYWVGDSMHIMEYRLLNGDTIFKRDETIDYIVGSGQHTNSHIYEENGYLHQAPITYYTQSGKWDLAPGFEVSNSHFNRPIEAECITCHNGYPEQVKGSLNKYTTVKRGIDCERCHGPGSLHLEAVLAGKIHDTSKSPDYNIVNPRRMTTDQQNNLCQRCHLQGVSVLNDGASFFDFQPSQSLSDHWNVFMPEYKDKTDHMIMASHVERMKMSKCFSVSKKMSCVTCHNPHVSVKVTPMEQYNKACQSCHNTSKTLCTESEQNRNAKQNNCVTCHMAVNDAIDIPHVAVHDHFIRKDISKKDDALVDGFVGLKSYNTDEVSTLTRGRGFLDFYERFDHIAGCLDSAIFYLEKSETQEKLMNKDLIRAYYLKNDYAKIIDLAKNFKAIEIKDFWNAYRIGEAYSKMNAASTALPYLEQAAKLLPFGLDFQNKLAECYSAVGNTEKAKRKYEFILKEFPKYAIAHSNLGFIYMQEKNWVNAQKFIGNAAALDPNNVQARINLAVVYYNQNNIAPIKKVLQSALQIDATNEQVRQMLADIAK